MNDLAVFLSGERVGTLSQAAGGLAPSGQQVTAVL